MSVKDKLRKQWDELSFKRQMLASEHCSDGVWDDIQNEASYTDLTIQLRNLERRMGFTA